ncbi:MAG: chemotaxis protein CheA [Nevskiaceae bacterium]|nr:MAG: chemotaxis protein CheA [Nevskiaceae bacterium]TBR72172.1 MAG: chemotaxis protein CheA [Nevskiaceae bacterium]
MDTDLTRFHAAFFEESFENVDVMEQALVALDPATAVDPETVNTIFRAAHSIKGGAATFGFTAVADFTHHLESLLDAARSGSKALDPDTVNLLLEAVDVVRALLGAARDGDPFDPATATGVQTRLAAALTSASTGAGASPAVSPVPAASTTSYSIHFVPNADLFRTGNEPLHILRDLQTLGPTEVEAELDALPALDELEPETSYLGWRITLHAACPEQTVRDIFAWVEDDCTLDIQPLADTSPMAATEPRPSAITTPATAPAKTPAPPPHIAPAVHHAEGTSIRVQTSKIDALMNLVGELVITQAMLSQLGSQLDPVRDEKLLAGLGQLDRQTRLLQEAVMSTRMLPVANVFSRFPRIVHDLAGKLGKEVELVTTGEETELDKSVIEKITDPLTHLVRNSLDHGIETAGERIAAGKPEIGTIHLSASHEGGHIVIRVADDGRGLDREHILAKAHEKGMAVSDTMPDKEVWALVFAPGFSTSEHVTELSGRGVGMDVVRRNVQALSGQIDVESHPGKGATVTIRLPLTLAILDGMLVRVGAEIFIVPLNVIVESMQPHPDQLSTVMHEGRIVRVRGEHAPLIALHRLFGIPDALDDPTRGILVIVEAAGQKVALLVDELVGQQQVVIKSLETNYRRVPCVSGATILGDGRVSLILDAGQLVQSTRLAAAA